YSGEQFRQNRRGDDADDQRQIAHDGIDEDAHIDQEADGDEKCRDEQRIPQGFELFFRGAVLDGAVDGESGQKGTDDPLQVDRFGADGGYHHDQKHHQKLPVLRGVEAFHQKVRRLAENDHDDRYINRQFHDLYDEVGCRETCRVNRDADGNDQQRRNV